jgi:hypothetical protein
MKIIFIFLLMIFIIIFYKSPALGSLLEFNPFKNQINLRNTSVERFLGQGLELNKETNATNPLEIKSKFKKKPKYHNLVIVSIGDYDDGDNNSNNSNNSNGGDGDGDGFFFVNNSLGDTDARHFDIMVVFSAKSLEETSKYKQLANYIYINNGTKFQNLYFVYNNHKDVLDKYDRFFYLDNTIIIDTESINKMFDISERYKLMICGPTFTPEVDVVTDTTNITNITNIMRSKKKNSIRYVNFIECSVPLLNRHALDKLMKYYDPALLDEGVDYLYIWACGETESNKYALVDTVSCSKSSSRRISSNRNSIWDKFAKKWGIKHGKENHRVWKTIILK